MKYLIPISVLVLGIFLVNVEPTAAQGLVPCEGGGAASDSPCSACHLIQLANNVIIWLIGILTLVFAAIAMYAGFKLVTSGGNSGAKQDAKNMLVNALVGFILVLGAWVLIDTGLRALLKDGGTIDGNLWWQSISCDGWEQSTPTIEAYPPHEDTSGGNPGATVPPGGSGRNCPATPESEVVQIPSRYISGDPEKIRRDILPKLTAMLDAAAADGINIKVRDGWRPESEQVYLWNRRAEIGQVARPCSLGGNGSNHNSGTAIDVTIGCAKADTGCNSAQYRWMKANGGQYGFYNNLPRDTVHWSPTGR